MYCQKFSSFEIFKDFEYDFFYKDDDDWIDKKM